MLGSFGLVGSYNAGVGDSNPSPPTGKALVKDHGARAGLHRLFPQAVLRPRIEPISFESIVPACAERPGRPNAGQMTVGPKCHAKIGVAKLPLHHQRIGAFRDHQSDASVSQGVGSHAR